ncbi:MAG: leucine-rich repeat domain-containing protein [Oscillibacter sp.]|nr:leucine-rich repeat domain-containing protein [Oscillibacter sp.]
MKVRCEYCQNMVESGGDKICPYCGSPLPAPPEPPKPAPAPRAARPVFLLLPLLLIMALWLLPQFLNGGNGGGTAPKGPDSSVSKALESVNSGSAKGSSYQVIISYYLEGGRIDTAYQAARELMERPDGATYMSWCVQEFSTFGRVDLSVRLAMASGALYGAQELYDAVEDIPLSQALPESPLCQAMELALGRTAEAITLADLQTVTGLSIGRRDTLSGAQDIGVAFDQAGEELIPVTVEFKGESSGLGTVCFQGLQRLTLNDPNLRTKEDLFLPNLKELYFLLPMDAENLVKFSHLKGLERFQIGGGSLTSLEGLDQLSSLKELRLFATGLTDLSLLASQRQLTHLNLIQNDELTSVASLSQATHLKSLSLSGKAITDLSPLASLRGLEALSVTGTSIRSAAFLSGMTGLKTLVLTENKELGTVPELSSLPGLERLTLDSDESFASQQDLGALAGLRALKLRVSKKLSFLQPLQNLEELTVYTYQSTWDVSGLAQFQNLKRLSFRSGNDFYDGYTVYLEGLNGLRNLPLEELDLGGKGVYGPIDPLLEIKTLQVLNLSGTFSEGTDYRKFANLKQLRELDLGGYRAMLDIPPGPHAEYWSYEAGPAAAFVDQLGLLTELERLNLSGCGVENIDSLKSLTGLAYLDLSGNLLSDLSALSGLENLRYLNLSGNRIGDYSPVENRDGLTLIR